MIEGKRGFGFAPEDGAGLEGSGEAIGPGVTAEETGSDPQGEGRFASAGLPGEDGEHAGRKPKGPAPIEGGAGRLCRSPGGGEHRNIIV